MDTKLFTSASGCTTKIVITFPRRSITFFLRQFFSREFSCKQKPCTIVPVDFKASCLLPKNKKVKKLIEYSRSSPSSPQVLQPENGYEVSQPAQPLLSFLQGAVGIGYLTRSGGPGGGTTRPFSGLQIPFPEQKGKVVDARIVPRLES